MADLSPEKLEALLNGPAQAPPAGITSQLDNPPNHRAASSAVLITCLIVTSIAVAMRLYTKVRVIRKLDIADC